MRCLFQAFTVFGFLCASQTLAQSSPVVVELYTSQGCSSCPPADAMLHDLAKRDDVIALAMHVDYWDYIGWKDSFATPEYTARQHSYARAARVATVYTPQMIVNGEDHVIGSRPMQVMDLVQSHSQRETPVTMSMARSGDTLEISAQSSESGDYVVQLVRYIPEETVSIRRGENAGRQLSYAHVVNGFDNIGTWDGQSDLELTTVVDGDAPVVVLIQRDGHGPIVAAAELR